MRKKVIMIYSLNFLPYEGWYLRAFNQARTLARAGYDVTLLAWDRLGTCPAEEDREGVRIKRFRIKAGVARGPHKNALGMAKFLWSVGMYLWQHEFDVVHCFNMEAIVIGPLLARLRRKKAALDLCEPDYYRGFWSERLAFLLHVVNWLEKVMARRFDHLFVHNTYQIDKFRAYGITRLTQVGSYPNRTMLAGGVADRGDGHVVIGRLGTFYANNGFEELIAAFHRLREKEGAKGGSRSKFKLFLAGKVFDSYRETFDSLIRSLDGQVELRGPFHPDELAGLYGEIDISILTYGKKWFGNVTPTKLFESLANGVPVVANAIGDVPRILEEGQCGVIVDEKDPDSICNGILQLAADPERFAQMRQRALQLARGKYTWEACQDKFLAAYRQLV